MIDPAAIQRQRDAEEEEEMTPPDAVDATQYEYKIIRSASGAFNVPAKFRAVLEEEARAGWDLLEKLSDHRVRLRRHVKWREQDATLSQDPYRTRIGMGDDARVIWILVGVTAVVGLILSLVLLLR